MIEVFEEFCAQGFRQKSSGTVLHIELVSLCRNYSDNFQWKNETWFSHHYDLKLGKNDEF